MCIRDSITSLNDRYNTESEDSTNASSAAAYSLFAAIPANENPDMHYALMRCV